MGNINISAVTICLLALFFFVGGVVNAFAPDPIQRDYARWGYPEWFHWLTATFELATAALLAYQPTRTWGVLLGATVMVGAIGTLLRHGEIRRAFLPGVVLALLAYLCSFRING